MKVILIINHKLYLPANARREAVNCSNTESRCNCRIHGITAFFEHINSNAGAVRVFCSHSTNVSDNRFPRERPLGTYQPRYNNKSRGREDLKLDETKSRWENCNKMIRKWEEILSLTLKTWRFGSLHIVRNVMIILQVNDERKEDVLLRNISLSIFDHYL